MPDVIIKDNSDGKVDVIYCRPNTLQATKITLPKKAFLLACSEYADNIAAEAK